MDENREGIECSKQMSKVKGTNVMRGEYLELKRNVRGCAGACLGEEKFVLVLVLEKKGGRRAGNGRERPSYIAIGR